MSHTVCRLLGGDANLEPETEARHIAMREASLLAHAHADDEADQYHDMPTSFKFLSAEDREELAKKMVELSLKGRDQDLQRGYQDLRRKDHEIQEKSMSLKRKRCDDIESCYQLLKELGITLDAHAKVHILESVAILTKQDVGIDGKLI